MSQFVNHVLTQLYTKDGAFATLRRHRRASRLSMLFVGGVRQGSLCRVDFVEVAAKELR